MATMEKGRRRKESRSRENIPAPVLKRHRHKDKLIVPPSHENYTVRLHDDVLLMIFQLLDVSERLCASSVCRRWHSLVASHAAWHTLALSRFPAALVRGTHVSLPPIIRPHVACVRKIVVRSKGVAVRANVEENCKVWLARTFPNLHTLHMDVATSRLHISAQWRSTLTDLSLSPSLSTHTPVLDCSRIGQLTHLKCLCFKRLQTTLEWSRPPFSFSGDLSVLAQLTLLRHFHAECWPADEVAPLLAHLSPLLRSLHLSSSATFDTTALFDLLSRFTALRSLVLDLVLTGDADLLACMRRLLQALPNLQSLTIAIVPVRLLPDVSASSVQTHAALARATIVVCDPDNAPTTPQRIALLFPPSTSIAHSILHT